MIAFISLLPSHRLLKRYVQNVDDCLAGGKLVLRCLKTSVEAYYPSREPTTRDEMILSFSRQGTVRSIVEGFQSFPMNDKPFFTQSPFSPITFPSIQPSDTQTRLPTVP